MGNITSKYIAMVTGHRGDGSRGLHGQGLPRRLLPLRGMHVEIFTSNPIYIVMDLTY